MKTIHTALSNEVFDGKDHIQKHVIENYFKSIFGGDELEIIDAFDSQLEVLHEEEGWFAMTKLSGKTLMIYSNEEIRLIAQEVKYFHETNVESIGISQFGKAYKFLGGGKNISKILKILERDPVLLHNDLVEGNILIEGKDIHLIDFEYSGYGNQIFDVASFIIERQLINNQESLWVSQFENINKEELRMVKEFLSEFWALWAKYMYEMTSQEVYLKVMKWHDKK